MRESTFHHQPIPQEDGEEADDDLEQHAQTSPLFENGKGGNEGDGEEGLGFQSYNGIQRNDESKLHSNGNTFKYAEGRNSIISVMLRGWTIILIAMLFTALFFQQNRKAKSQNDIPLTHPEFETEVGEIKDDSPGQGHQMEYKHSASDNTFQVSDSDGSSYGGTFQPSLPNDFTSTFSNSDDLIVGYLQYPHIFNNTLVFCSEGDVYMTTVPSFDVGFENVTMPAMRLTSTVGNTNTPKINPKYPYLLAFTATYTGTREAYLMDLRPSHRSGSNVRLTYTDTLYGVRDIIGWEDDGTTLVYSSYNREVAMQDVRLYKIRIMGQNSTFSGFKEESISSEASHRDVSGIRAIPLSQAIDSVVDPLSKCRFFTRYKQTSNTMRYVGGTAESLWASCHFLNKTVGITSDYNGTSKAPQIYNTLIAGKNESFILFLSDRHLVKKGDQSSWTPDNMNLWAAPIPLESDLTKSDDGANDLFRIKPFQITSVSCELNGLQLQEYGIDDVSGNLVLRIGADIFIMKEGQLLDTFSKRQIQSKGETSIERLPISVYSDFNNLHERVVRLHNPTDVSTLDFFQTSYGTISALTAARGQLFVNPLIKDIKATNAFTGSGMNIPPRRYRVAPGSMSGGFVRILGAWFISSQDDEMSRRSLVLATDPLSSTAELAFYILDTSAQSAVEFINSHDLPRPLIGGHINGGSVSQNGLGSIKVSSVTVSPCGRRVAWTDTDGRIVCMTIPISQGKAIPETPVLTLLPDRNENDEPMIGIGSVLNFSPAGRYLAIEHSAKNQFKIITVADLDDPITGRIEVTRLVQSTLDRFNSVNPVWGKSAVDLKLEELQGSPRPATMLYFLTDRDSVLSGHSSPWGTRAPQPQFRERSVVYALPLISKEDELESDPLEEIYGGPYVGGGAAELMNDHVTAWTNAIGTTEEEKGSSESDSNNEPTPVTIPDVSISFGVPSEKISFARRSYWVSEIPAANYFHISQLQDDSSLLLAEIDDTGSGIITYFSEGAFPNNSITSIPLNIPGLSLQNLGLSSDMNFIYFTFSGMTKVIPNKLSDFSSLFLSDGSFNLNIVDTGNWAVTIWPQLEYQQMYADAWRLLRDYYYDTKMGGVSWEIVYERYLPLVRRCGRREELDDILKQMSSELSALHVFVYGGEYNDPTYGDIQLASLNDVDSLGAMLERSMEKGGYVIKEIPQLDPDFKPMDGTAIYCPISDLTLKNSGQRGLQVGDIITAVNGENVLNSPDINALLRGLAGMSVRLEVVRTSSPSSFSLSDESKNQQINREPLIVVPITSQSSANLKYAAWEWKTRNMAKELAQNAGFSIGYMHLRSMSGAEGEDAFVRGFYPDYDKQGLIIDVRHNNGGNIDSWLLTSLQRKAWMYFQGRATNITNGGLGWDEQFAFRGHIVILVDEKTSSDGEGFARGVSELGLGKIVGTRTWGGGIWLSSDNNLVDGGIATAPEYGTYNDKFGWGLGIEQMGVEPDVIVDNDPKETFFGRDNQLEEAIKVLKEWMHQEPVVMPKNPGPHRDMSLKTNFCDGTARP